MILPALFSATIFLSAALLFSIQPIIAKMALPLLGGTPAVWTTCMVFFQGALLAGYLYAHLLSRRLTPRSQAVVHLALLLTAGLTLPFGVADTSVQSLTPQTSPAAWLLLCLSTTVGLPFFAISASAPLLQRWFSKTGHKSAGDPYFLYAASNLGSLIALLSYPVLVEPNLRLTSQSRYWTAGYVLLGVLFLLCLARMLRASPCGAHAPSRVPAGASPTGAVSAHHTLTQRQRFLWIALAFVPSSLMLGVTTYLTTDIASIPLLWILPLSLYLLTFIFAFARRTRVPGRVLGAALPIGAIGLIYLTLSEATEPVWLLVTLHLVFFFVAAMICHGRLASERPSPAHLTEYYFWLSLGGVLGGLFNALLAPNLFRHVIEYPLAIVLACLLTPVKTPSAKEHAAVEPGVTTGARPRWSDLLLPAALGLVAVALAVGTPQLRNLSTQFRLALTFGPPLLLGYTLVDRPVRFGLGLTAILLASSLYSGGHGRALHAERNFFGVLRVTRDPLGKFRRLVHGNTVHGRQSLDPARQSEPLSYYHRSGPLGQIFKIFDAKVASTNVAVVGLGAGSMACYARPGQHWTYFEINPAVISIAENTHYFTFVANCRAADCRTIVGDARLRLREAKAGEFNLLVLDAFSSDAIPVHLLTREAIQLYLSKLADDGLLAFHISNRCLDLEPVLGDLAASANLICYSHDEIEPSTQELMNGRDQSHWVVLARRVEDIGRLIKDSRWLPIKPQSRPQIWTDDFSNIWSVFKWR